MQKALEHQNEAKKEKIREEEERIDQMKKQLDVFREERVALKQVLLDDLDQVRDGDKDLEDVKDRLVRTISPEGLTDEGSQPAVVSIKTTSSKSPKKGLHKIRSVG